MMGFLKKLVHGFVCLVYFKSIQELRGQKERLILAANQLRRDVEDARARKREIKEDVEKWLADAKKYLEEARVLEDKIQANQRRLISRLDWSQRCWLSYEIEHLKQKMIHHLRNSHFDRAVLATLWESDFDSGFVPSQSLKSALIGVLNAMKDYSDPSIIAVYGPRGVGKSTLAELVEKKAQELLNFKVARLVVSQNTTTEQVQAKLAAFLGLSLQGIRAEYVSDHLRLNLKTKRRILIILDNVCRQLNLASIGIPYHVSCKVVVTTSDDQVLKSCSLRTCKESYSITTLEESCFIRTSKVIRLGPLDKPEAWKLLEKNLSPDTSSEIKQVAKQVAEEFEHSVVSIMTLGRALREKVADDWKMAYRSLKSSLVEGENENINIVCKSVKLSYDYLKDLETKKCFLLCSLFPEDYPIAVQDLERYAWGLGIYQNTNSIEMVGKKVGEAIKILVNSFLLLKNGKTHVRIPNVIREAALLIASNDERFLRIKSMVGLRERPNNEVLKSYSAISYVASQQEELNAMEFPSENLQILFFGGHGYKISNEVLLQSAALKVVVVHHCLLSLNSLRKLTNLKALHLEHCNLDGLPSLGELKQLEVLSFQGSDISELPNQIGELKNLLLLDLSGCQRLQRIPLNLIWELSRLEELYFSGFSFGEWWSREKIAEGINISLPIINSISSWATESFENQGSNNELRALKVSALFQNESNELKLSVTHLDRDCILVVQNHVVPNLVQSVRKVKVQHCDNWQEVFQDGCILHTGKDNSGEKLSDLTSLELEDISELSSLARICCGETLKNLSTLKLKDCRKLQSLFSMSLVESLEQLETLEIHGCNDLKEIIAKTTDKVDAGVDEAICPNDVNISSGVNESVHHPAPLHPHYFPKLKTLLVTGCGVLEYIARVPGGQVFQGLTRLEIINCLQLKEVFSSEEVAERKEIEVPLLENLKLGDLMSLTTFCPDNISIKLPKLQHLEVGACKNLSKNSMFKLMGNHQLKEFRLFDTRNQLCENIFDYEGGCGLSCLKILKLHNLHELQGIGKVSAQMVTLQKLTHLEVVKCNKLKSLFTLLLARNLLELRKLIVRECDGLEKLIGRDQISSSLSSCGYKPIYFPNLEEISIEDCKQLKSLFPVSVARLPNLKIFRVRRAPALVHIFRKEGNPKVKTGKGKAKVKTEEMVKLPFPNLETLQLEKLTALVTFHPVDYCCEFPSVVSLKISGCTSLVTEFKMPVSASDDIVYTKTHGILLPKPESYDKFSRSVTIMEIPNRNGDINWFSLRNQLKKASSQQSLAGQQTDS